MTSVYCVSGQRLRVCPFCFEVKLLKMSKNRWKTSIFYTLREKKSTFLPYREKNRYFEKWTYKVTFEVYYRAKRDKKEAT